MKVAFIPTYVSGVQFYRVWQPYLAMKEMFKRDEFVVTWYTPDQYTMHEWEWNLYEPDKFQATYLNIDAACRWADVVVWMGLHLPKSLDLFVHMRGKHGKPFISEFDDYIFSIPLNNAASKFYKPGTDYTRIAVEQMKRSDALVVSTPHLQELYKPINPNTYVVENTVDLSLWLKAEAPSPGKPSHRVTIGWMGGGTHNEDHEMIQEAVVEVLAKCPEASFHYVSGCPRPDKFKDIKRIKWEHAFRPIDKYPKWISRKGFDIGIAPLVDNEFNRAKSNLRWLEYSAMGKPTVASPLTHFNQSIKHGKTGLIARDHKEWVCYLEALIKSPKLRLDIGTAARREVEKNWSPQDQARKYRAVLKEVAYAVTNTQLISNAC